MRDTVAWAIETLDRILQAKPETAQDWHNLVNDLGAVRTRLELALLEND